MEKKRSKVRMLAGTVAAIMLLSGCGEAIYGTIAPLPRTMYERVEYMVTDVHKENMESTLSLSLKPANVTKIDYSVDESELEVEEIAVQVGDSVKKGQILVTFKSDELKKSIDYYSDELNKKQLLLDHYTRVSNVTYNEKDRMEKYGVVLEELADEVDLARTYLEEEQERYSKCQIVASEDGYISYISKQAMSGIAEAGDTIITENCGKNHFSATTNDNFEFNIGDVYKAGDESLSYDMRVVEIIEEETGDRTIVFEAVDNTVDPGIQVLNMTIDKPLLKDVIYVDRDAVYHNDDKSFVFVVTDEGFLNAVYVDAGETVGDYTIIKSGLNGTEKVAKK